jgi:serine kinase of HPr protein (carbohydrate metabolism regulator)
MTTILTSETVHGTSVARDGKAVLITGASGAGKSDLALRLIDRGAKLVSDDYTILTQVEGQLIGRAPDTIKGKIEVRGVGIVKQDVLQDVPVALVVDLADPAERFPMDAKTRLIAGLHVPIIGLNPFEASAPIKVEIALSQVGL